MALKQLAESAAALEEAVRTNPSFTEARYQLGKVYQAQRFLPQALAEFQLAVGLEPEKAVFHQAAAMVHRELGEDKEAMTENALQLTELEKEVLRFFLVRNTVDEEYFGKDFHLLRVTAREMTGSGFMTDIVTNKSFKQAGIRSSRWGRIGATLNNNINISFVVYVDDYVLNGIEGFTYGDTAWPEEITSFKMRELGSNEF